MLAELRRLLRSAGWPLLGLTLLAAALRFGTLGGQSLWYDEYATQLVIAAPLRDVIDNVEYRESNPPVFYWAEWAWARVFGSSDFALRSLPALAGTLTVPFAYLAGQELSSRRAGLILAGLVATSPWLIWYSQEARNYAVLGLFAAASFYFFAASHKRPTTLNLLGWSLAAGAAMLIHYFAGALVAAEAILLLIAASGRRAAVIVALLGPIAAGLSTLPMLLDQEATPEWIATIELGARLDQLPKLFAVGNSYPSVAAELIVAAAVVLGLAGLALWGDARTRRGAALAGLVAALGFGAVMAAVVADQDYVLGRNLIWLWVPIAAVAAIGISVVQPRWLGTAVAAGVCLLYVGLAIEVAADWRLQRIAWGEGAELVGPASEPRLVIARGGYQAEPLPRYLEGAGPLVEIPPQAREYVTLDYDDPSRGYLCWWGGACAMPSAEPPLPVPPGAQLIEERERSGFTARRYRLPSPPLAELPVPTDARLFQQLPVPPG